MSCGITRVSELNGTIHGIPYRAHCLSKLSPFCPTDVPEPSSGSVSVVALNEAGKVRVAWRRRILGSGQKITGYSVQYRRRGTTSYTTRSVSGSSTTSYTITNLNLGVVYEVRVASVGPLGLSGYCCGSGKPVTTFDSECRVQTELKDAFCGKGIYHTLMTTHKEKI